LNLFIKQQFVFGDTGFVLIVEEKKLIRVCGKYETANRPQIVFARVSFRLDRMRTNHRLPHRKQNLEARHVQAMPEIEEGG
jgi:hypothetical protein